MTYLNSMPTEQIRAPEHLLSYSWLELEKNQALLVFSDLEEMARILDKKLNASRVHQARVILRRWYSVWDIMAIDGWEDSGYPDGGFELSIGASMRKLNKSLGTMRDLDVSLDLARELKVSGRVIDRLKKKRKKLRDKTEAKISELKPAKLVDRLRNYLSDRSEHLQRLLKQQRTDSVLAESNHCAYIHLDQFLLQAEHQTRLLSENSKSNDELHELRLSIKRWRYLLSEFFGLTNLELVRAQQILGRIRDLNRLNQEVETMRSKLRKGLTADRLKARDLNSDRKRINALLKQQYKTLEPIVQKLPFGLRPYLVSL
jgi:CHAD domain-containing protein